MRLARPVYESLPLLYVAIGGVAIWLSSVDPHALGGKVALVIGFASEIAALTVLLRRFDSRRLRREYSGLNIELPPRI